MYLKTSGPHFLKYGRSYKNSKKISDNLIKNLEVAKFEVHNKKSKNLYSYPDETIIICEEGIALLCVLSKDNNIEYFVIHGTVFLNAKIYFNILPISEFAKISLYSSKIETKIKRLNYNFAYKPIHNSFNIDEIYTYYYNVRDKDYYFEGERHNFCELCYVDTGKLEVTIENQHYTLSDHQLILFGKKEFHAQRVLGAKPCSYLTIIFDMDESEFALIKNTIFKVSKSVIDLLNFFTREISNKFPYHNDILITYLKLLIIELLRYDFNQKFHSRYVSYQSTYENKTLSRIIDYMEKNLEKHMLISDICKEFNLSKTSIQNLFKVNLKTSPKSYLNKLKLNRSKHLIKEEKYTLSEISVLLGFTSPQYFSRAFSKEFKLPPRQYSKSLKVQ